MKLWLPVAALSALLVGCGTAAPDETGGGATLAAASDPSSGIHGRTVMSPGCPVQRISVPCRVLGVAAHIDVTRAGSSKVVARLDTTADGTFSVDLKPGKYTVTAKVDKGIPTPQANRVSVTVTPDGYARVVLPFDSGIRGPAVQSPAAQ